MKSISSDDLMLLLNHDEFAKNPSLTVRITGLIEGFSGPTIGTQFLFLNDSFDLAGYDVRCGSPQKFLLSNKRTRFYFSKRGDAAPAWARGEHAIYLPIDMTLEAGLRFELSDIRY